MSLQQQLLDLGELFNFSNLSIFTQNIPIEWVASALDLSAQATIRRRLPSDQVLWLVLGMALFRDEPVHEVARRLNICAQSLASHELLARSGVTEARKRLGANPVEGLFLHTGNQWGCERYDGDTWQDLQVLAMSLRRQLYSPARQPDVRQCRWMDKFVRLATISTCSAISGSRCCSGSA